MNFFEVYRSVFWGTQREVLITRQNESADESFESMMCEVVTDRTDLTELEITSLTCTGYVLLGRKSLIKSDTKFPTEVDTVTVSFLSFCLYFFHNFSVSCLAVFPSVQDQQSQYSLSVCLSLSLSL